MITLEVELKAKVFGLYLQCDFLFDGKSRKLTGVHITDNYVDVLSRGYSKCPLTVCQLILTPIEDITDEHAILIAKMQNTLLLECGKDLKVYKNAKHPLTVIGWVNDTPIKVELTTWSLNPFSLDKLRAWGYHTPCHGITDLYEAGIAIKPTI